MPKLSREYIAGILDGEGCISIYHQKVQKGKVYLSYNVRVIVGMTDPLVVHLLRDQYGGSVWLRKRPAPWKASYTWCLTGKIVEKFLNDILPFLMIKKGQAMLALELRKHINGRKFARAGHKGLLKLVPGELMYRQSLKDKMHRLNQKGKIT